MAVSIDNTVGGSAANSFVSLAEAETYMESRLNASLWDAASTDSKNRALVEATRELGTCGWCGGSASSTQALPWPRQWAPNPDDPYGQYYTTDEVPQRVKDAQMELAFQFIKAGATDVAAIDSLDNVVTKQVDVLSTTYDPHLKKRGLQRFPRVWGLIAPLLDGAGSGLEVVRG